MTAFMTQIDICTELGLTIREHERLMEANEYPQPLRLNLRKRVWLRSQHEQFLASLQDEDVRNQSAPAE